MWGQSIRGAPIWKRPMGASACVRHLLLYALSFQSMTVCHTLLLPSLSTLNGLITLPKWSKLLPIIQSYSGNFVSPWLSYLLPLYGLVRMLYGLVRMAHPCYALTPKAQLVPISLPSLYPHLISTNQTVGRRIRLTMTACPMLER